MIFEAGEGKVVLDAPSLLALVLEVASTADAKDVAAPAKAGVGIGDAREEDVSIFIVERAGTPGHVLIGDLEIVDPRVLAMLPAGKATPFLDLCDCPSFIGGNPAVEGFAGLVAVLDREFEQVLRRRREVDLSEIEIF
ncbi:MAG: hypothetical protein LOX97_10785, partial [Sphingomonas sp.]|nr:hypothetical protein [Sphingomonas sp.]